jgi:type IV pilus assembly protein PilN
MIRINLLPVREERRKASAQRLGAMLVATLAGSLLLAGAIHGMLRHQISSTHDLSAATQAEIQRFEPQLKQVEEFKKTKAEIEQKLGVIQSLHEARSGPVHVLDELATHTPDRIWVNKIAIKSGKLTLEGMSLDNELVALFLTALEESPYFKGVELLETQAKDKDGFKLNQFEVSALMTSPAAEARGTAPAAADPAAEPGPAGKRGRGKPAKTAQAAGAAVVAAR